MEDKPRALVFSAAFEAVHQRFSARLTPELIAQIQALGVDFKKLRPAYPLEVWDRLIRLLLPALYPGLQPAEAAEQMGREFMLGLNETMVGKAVVGLARILGPKRMLDRTDRNFKQLGNYGTAKIEYLGPNEATLETRMNPEFLWEDRGKSDILDNYRLGILRGLFLLMGHPAEVEIAGQDAENHHAIFRLKWR